jgi:hypothetical protein
MRKTIEWNILFTLVNADCVSVGGGGLVRTDEDEV